MYTGSINAIKLDCFSPVNLSFHPSQEHRRVEGKLIFLPDNRNNERKCTVLFKCKILGQPCCFFSRGHSAMKSGHLPTIVPKTTVEVKWSDVSHLHWPISVKLQGPGYSGQWWWIYIYSGFFWCSASTHTVLLICSKQVCVAKQSILGKLRNYYKLLKISVLWPAHPLPKNWWFQRENTTEIQPSFLLQDNAESQIALPSTFSAP